MIIRNHPKRLKEKILKAIIKRLGEDVDGQQFRDNILHLFTIELALCGMQKESKLHAIDIEDPNRVNKTKLMHRLKEQELSSTNTEDAAAIQQIQRRILDTQLLTIDSLIVILLSEGNTNQ
eukprot:TRINITY_DN12648_c0_g1_i1.p3 TRINITY_DN12648_c0_g1~~TRINITY_DN12648_c0_g1_i1.p3  ORF type:complete len:121 (+),score=7.35 TRINITY_DN12648_c0_g1_i1:447-809(+)